jgi:hypothetical protein
LQDAITGVVGLLENKHFPVQSVILSNIGALDDAERRVSDYDDSHRERTGKHRRGL